MERALGADAFGLVETDDGLCHRVVVVVADTADRRQSLHVREPGGVLNRRVLRSRVRAMDQPSEFITDVFTVPDRHLESVQSRLGGHLTSGAPTNDPAGEHVLDERCERHRGPGRNVGEVDHPEPVGSIGAELTLHQIRWAKGLVIGDRGPNTKTAPGALEAEFPHQPFDRAARNLEAITLQQMPHFPRAGQSAAFLSILEHLDDQNI